VGEAREDTEKRRALMGRLFSVFPRGGSAGRLQLYVEATASLSVEDLGAAVAHAEQQWEQQTAPPIATLRRFAGQARESRGKADRTEPERAREVALSRLRARGFETPTEEHIWREFVLCGSFLGVYSGPASRDLVRGFAERWIAQAEERDGQLYGAVRPSTVAWAEGLRMELDGTAPLGGPAHGRLRLARAERLAVWDEELRQATAEGASARRLDFLRRARERLAQRHAKEPRVVEPEPIGDALAAVFD
jgi:hypothetical protein